MTDTTPKARWFYPTPSWFLIGLLIVECLLWLSERFQWFTFNHHKGWTVLIALASIGVALLIVLLWFVTSLIFRWRLHFRIRTLLVMIVAVAVPCIWLGVEMYAAMKQKEAVDQLRQQLGAAVYYDCLVVPDAKPAQNWLRSMLGDDFIPDAKPAPDWLRSMLGDDFFAGVSDITAGACWGRLDGLPHADAGLASLRKLLPQRDRALPQTPVFLDLVQTDVTDAGLEHLQGMTQLSWLNLWRTEITDAGLAHLNRLPHLQWLNLDDTNVGDAGLMHLQELPQLQSLYLGYTKVTDAGLVHLETMTRLQSLDLRGTKVTDAGASKLQQALPNCKITR